MRDARREIERDERRIELEMRKDRIVDQNRREGIDMMVNSPTRRTDYGVSPLTTARGVNKSLGFVCL